MIKNKLQQTQSFTIQSITRQQVNRTNNYDHQYNCHQNIWSWRWCLFLPICHQWIFIYHSNLISWHYDLNCVLRMNCLLKWHCCITTCFLAQHDWPSWMLLSVLWYVVNVIVNNKPQILLSVMFSNLLPIVNFLWCHYFQNFIICWSIFF